MNRVCSIFAQLLQLFPRGQFQQAVQQHHAERHARGFTCWGQFVAMLFCQLGSVNSLRDITNGLAASTATALTTAGLHVIGVTSGTVPADTTETLVHYYPGQVGQALAVMSHLSGAVMLQSDPTVAPGTVVLDVGSTVAVITAAARPATTPATSSAGAPAPSTTTTTVPSPQGQTPSSASDVLQAWDPRPC